MMLMIGANSVWSGVGSDKAQHYVFYPENGRIAVLRLHIVNR